MSDILPGYTPYFGASVLPNSATGGVQLAQMRVATYLSLAVPQYAPAFMNWLPGFPNAASTLPAPKPLGPNFLPLPTGYFDYEPPALDVGNMPFQASAAYGALIYIASLTTPKFETVQNDNQGNPQYDAVYSIQATCWVQSRYIGNTMSINQMHDAWRAAAVGRNNLLTLMRACFVLQPDIGTLGVCRVDLGTMSEDHPMVSRQDKGATFLAGGSLNFRIWCRETLTVAPLGIVADPVNIEEALLPVHPALYGLNMVPSTPGGF